MNVRNIFRIVIILSLLFISFLYIFSPQTEGWSSIRNVGNPVVIENGSKVIFRKVNDGNSNSTGFYIYDLNNGTEKKLIGYKNRITDLSYLPQKNWCIFSDLYDVNLKKLDCSNGSIETLCRIPNNYINSISVSSKGEIYFSSSQDSFGKNQCYFYNRTMREAIDIFNYSHINDPVIDHQSNSIYFMTGDGIYLYDISSTNISFLIEVPQYFQKMKLLSNENELIFNSKPQYERESKNLFRLNLTTLKIDTYFSIKKSLKHNIYNFDIFPNEDKIAITSWGSYGPDNFLCNLDGSNWTKISNIDQPEPWKYSEDYYETSFFFQPPYYGVFLVIIFVVISIFIVIKIVRRKSSKHESDKSDYTAHSTYNQLDNIKIADCPKCSLPLFKLDEPTEKYCPKCNSYFTKSDES